VTIRSTTLAASAALWGASLLPTQAMPVSNLAAGAHVAPAPVQEVAVVCGPYRCWWRPDYYYPPPYAPPRAYYGYWPGWPGYGWSRPPWAGYRRGW
jgi:hypothetical protein